MKKQKIILASALCGVLLAGCNITITAPQSSDVQSHISPSSSSMAIRSEAAIPEMERPSSSAPNRISDESTVAASIFNDSTNNQKEYADLSFLTEEQQDLYAAACKISGGLFGLGDYIAYQWNYSPILLDNDNDASIQMAIDDYVLYDVSYDVFSDEIHKIFTDQFLATTDYSIKFVDFAGKMAVSRSLKNDILEGVTAKVNDLYSDTYRPKIQSESLVEFVLISHYDRNWDDSKSGPMDVYTIEYPIRMVYTADGWRIDEFHSTYYG